VVAAGAAIAACRLPEHGESAARVMTVTGPIESATMGFTLPHEHVLVDFVGAEQVGKHRYDPDEAFSVILPHLRQAKALGCETFVECTPAYIGRDAALVKRLSEASGLRILTNAGYYGAADDKFVPAHAYDETPDQLADRWVAEWRDGIEGTGVRPGFMKIGVDRGSLSEIDEKLVRAAARAHLRTGLTVMSHTGPATPAREQLAVLREEGVHPSAWIWTHAQAERNNDEHRDAARAGAWIAFDGIHRRELERDLAHLRAMKGFGLLDRVLLSHDAGWYSPGEPGGGDFRPFVDLFESFLPALDQEGFTKEEIRLLTVENPARAFGIRVRPTENPIMG
jgi:phosphotriesterase-related protein